MTGDRDSASLEGLIREASRTAPPPPPHGRRPRRPVDVAVVLLALFAVALVAIPFLAASAFDPIDMVLGIAASGGVVP